MLEIFKYIKPSQIANLIGVSPVRFSQKLHGHKIKGVEQKFNDNELNKLKEVLSLFNSSLANTINTL